MKAKKRTLKRIFIYACAAVPFVAYISQYLSVNAAYPQNRRNLYSFGEAFQTQGGEVTIKEAQLLDISEIKKDSEVMQALGLTASVDGNDDVRLAMIEAEFYNPGNEKIGMDLTTFHLESEGFSLQFFYPLMLYYNNTGMFLELEKGERITLKLPVPIFKVSFPKERWLKIAEQDFSIVTSLYPEKNMAEILFY